jgi:hypothetical protein
MDSNIVIFMLLCKKDNEQSKYFLEIPDYFPDGYSSGTLNYRTSGHFEVL